MVKAQHDDETETAYERRRKTFCQPTAQEAREAKTCGVTSRLRREGVLLLLVLMVLTGGCAGGPLTTREKGGLLGGGLGAGAGALIGGGKGAAIGGALGLLTGGLIGDQFQGQEHRQAWLQRQGNRQQRELNRQKRELRALRRHQEEDY